MTQEVWICLKFNPWHNPFHTPTILKTWFDTNIYLVMFKEEPQASLKIKQINSVLCLELSAYFSNLIANFPGISDPIYVVSVFTRLKWHIHTCFPISFWAMVIKTLFSESTLSPVIAYPTGPTWNIKMPSLWEQVFNRSLFSTGFCCCKGTGGEKPLVDDCSLKEVPFPRALSVL